MADDEQRPMRITIDPDSERSIPFDKMTGAGRRQKDVAMVHEKAGRRPPQAVDVEQAVLGAMLVDPSAIALAIEVLPEESFYDPRHAKIYTAMLSLFERDNPVDYVTLSEELRRRGELESVGGAYYLTELTSRVASAANVEYHGRIIAERSLLRRFIETTSILIGKAYDPAQDAFELLDEAENKIFQISDANLRKSSVSLGDAVRDTIERLESIHGQAQGITGVPTGFTRLDGMTSGWQKSDLIIIAARPSMGKTALSLSMARNMALHPEKPVGVAFFSLEMSAQQLAQRLLTSEARVDAQAARTGRMSQAEWRDMALAAGRLADAPIYIDDTPGLSILELRAKSRRLMSEHGLGCIIVDYLQLMHGSAGKNSNREQEIAQISRSLKALAKELDVPVIALAQLSRAVETRGGDKRPQLSDLRESGSIEQDADVVCFLYRAERYGITIDDNGNSTEGIGEVIIGKQRNGPIGVVEIAFVGQYARFENLTTHYQNPGDDFGGGGGYDQIGPGPEDYGGGDGQGGPPPMDSPF